MKSEGVIFDLDGTLIASETTYLRAWRSAAVEIGVELTDELYAQLMGLNRADTIVRLGAIWASAARAERFVDVSQRYYDRLVTERGHVLRPGIRALLEHLAKQRLPLAVATSSSRELALQTLADTALAAYFHAVVGGDEVERGKPHPEIYLTAAHRIGAEPARCTAFEDSATGATAALAAGMRVVLIPEWATGDLSRVTPVLTYANHAAAIELFGDRSR